MIEAEHRLHRMAPLPLQLVWHENKSTYLSVQKAPFLLSLRLHRLFYDAPTPVLEALIRYAMKRDRRSLAVIKQMAHFHFSRTQIAVKPLKKIGAVYDLQEILERMTLILPVQGLSIGWSNQRRFGKFRSITFGSYDKQSRQIRIHPLLDDSEVPLYFLEFIVYHEMLHDICPSMMDSMGRCFVHTKEFREREKGFPQFQQAKEWEKNCLTFFKKRKSHGRS